MSRSGYVDDCDDQWSIIRWRGAVKSAIRGKRGQAFLADLAVALDALPEKRLIANELQKSDGSVCAIGALGLMRGVNMTPIDPDNSEAVAATFDIADCLAREVVYCNDEVGWYNEKPEDRWTRMRAWVDANLHKPADAQ